MSAGIVLEPISLTDGDWVRGQFLSAKVQSGKPRTDADGAVIGKWPDKFIVTLLVGERTRQIEYRDEDAALAAFNATNWEDDVPKTTTVVLPVGHRAAKGFIFYFGRSVSQV